MKPLQLFLTTGLLALTGCTTIKSTLLQKDESNMCWQAMETKGIPITLEIPTHLRVAIVDTKYYFKANTSGDWDLVRSGTTALVSTQVDHAFIRTKKIFTVDPKRPLAGDVNFRFDLAEDKQYLKKIESDVTDRTIEDTSMALERLLIAIRPGKGTGGANGFTTVENKNDLYPVPGIRAVEIFEIDDPMFEQNVSAFICQHVPGSCPTICDVPPAAEHPAGTEHNPPQAPVKIQMPPIQPPAPTGANSSEALYFPGQQKR